MPRSYLEDNRFLSAEAVTCTRSAPRKGIHLPIQHAATVGWRKEKTPSCQLSGLQTCEGGDAEKEFAEDTQDYNRKGVLFNLTPTGVPFAAALRGKAKEQQQPQTHQVAVVGPATVEPRVPAALPQHEQQTAVRQKKSHWGLEPMNMEGVPAHLFTS
jgi:hypothetical protein